MDEHAMGQSVQLSADILSLVFKQLVGDYTSLANVGLTCHRWHILSLPLLLCKVDISCHNAGRLPQFENDEFDPEIHADFSDRYRPWNLVFRQRNFLRFIIANRDMAKHVRYLTWTLVWRNRYDDFSIVSDELRDFCSNMSLTDIDRETWNVFGRMTNVINLDLASLHTIDDEPYIRQNPATLFPRVTTVRLVGWMHRGLVRAIMDSTTHVKLKRLILDYTTDEVALVNGETMSYVVAETFALNSKKARGDELEDLGAWTSSQINHQNAGKAGIFPGPMWYPLYLLSSGVTPGLTTLDVRLAPFDIAADQRSYHTFFRYLAEVLQKTTSTLQSLTIIFGNLNILYEARRPRTCASGYGLFLRSHRPDAVRMAADLLYQIVKVFDSTAFPRLDRMNLEGFHILTTKHGFSESWHDTAYPRMFEMAKEIENRFEGVKVLEKKHIDHRPVFNGYEGNYDLDRNPQKKEKYRRLLGDIQTA